MIQSRLYYELHKLIRTWPYITNLRLVRITFYKTVIAAQKQFPMNIFAIPVYVTNFALKMTCTSLPWAGSAIMKLLNRVDVSDKMHTCFNLQFTISKECLLPMYHKYLSLTTFPISVTQWISDGKLNSNVSCSISGHLLAQQDLEYDSNAFSFKHFWCRLIMISSTVKVSFYIWCLGKILKPLNSTLT